MPFDVYTAMGALVRAEAARSAALSAGRSANKPSAPSADLFAGQPPVGETGFERPPTGRAADRADRRPGALPSALRRLTARLR
ncbi:hypothetical protein ACFVVX_28440 [Kitasatospora sp. NPDC058170]|uniref:hypothetical protein n=1 Tax=Kitasatospora sp. NPDC058170 TaxID=3346364 RepID=UPI0036D7F3E6